MNRQLGNGSESLMMRERTHGTMEKGEDATCVNQPLQKHHINPLCALKVCAN